MLGNQLQRNAASIVVMLGFVLLSVPGLAVEPEGGSSWSMTGRITLPSTTPVSVNVLCILGTNPLCSYAGPDFGAALAVDGNTAVVGHPYTQTVHVFAQENSLWMEVARFRGPEGFGTAVALEDDTILAGAAQSDQVAILSRDGGVWSWTTTFTRPDAGCLGHAVEVRDGRILIGDPCAARVHVLEREADGWSETATLSVPGAPGLGSRVAAAGPTVLARADRRALYAFERTEAGWTSQNIPTEATGNGFTADGDHFAVLGGDDILVYGRTPTGWSKMAVIQPQDASPFINHELFGWSFDLRQDTLIVGAPRDDPAPQDPHQPESAPDLCQAAVGTPICVPPRAGAAYIFEHRDGTWRQVAKLIGDPMGTDGFGTRVALDPAGTTAIVSAPFNIVSGAVGGQLDVDAEDSVFVFHREGGE